MKYFIPLIAISALAAQEAPSPDKTAPTAAAIQSTENARSIMIIDPKTRALDYVQAFEILRKDRPTSKIMIRTHSGMTLSNIAEMTATQSGSLLMVKSASQTGNKYQIVPVEDILEISYSS